MMPEDKDAQRRAGEQRRVARAIAEDTVLAAMTSKLDVPLIGAPQPAATIENGALILSGSDGLGLVDYDPEDDDGSREWALRQATDAANAELPIGDQVVTVTVVANIWKIDQLVAAMNHTFDHDCQAGQMYLNELAVMVVSELEELGNQLITDWRSGEAAGDD
jgi:hypothetical protein